MAITIKTPQEIAQDFLDTLKALKPELNTDQTDSDWYVKSRVIGGVVAGVYADLSRVSNDAFPQSARQAAVDAHLVTWTAAGLRSATYANGTVNVTGDGTAITVFAGTEFTHVPTGNVYQSTEEITLSAVTGDIPVTSVNVGADKNLLTGTSLAISNPPIGLLGTGTVIDPGIGSGTDDETTAEGAARVLQLIRSQRRGATESDYISWALAADASIRDAKLRRFPYGLGTVELILAAGTTDVDTAVDSGQTLSFGVSPAVVLDVQAYVDAVNPVTDTIYCRSVQQNTLDCTVEVTFVSGDQNTIEPTSGLTQGEMVKREIRRAIYKQPIGGLIVDNSGFGFIYFTDLEEQIDTNLHHQFGLRAQIVLHRKITLLGGFGSPKAALILAQKAVPGTITISEV